MSDEATTPHDDTSAPAPADPTASADEPLDLDAIERDLAGVEAALRRLDDGTYWTDEITGHPLPDDLLARDPVARTSP